MSPPCSAWAPGCSSPPATAATCTAGTSNAADQLPCAAELQPGVHSSARQAAPAVALQMGQLQRQGCVRSKQSKQSSSGGKHHLAVKRCQLRRALCAAQQSRLHGVQGRRLPAWSPSAAWRPHLAVCDRMPDRAALREGASSPICSGGTWVHSCLQLSPRSACLAQRSAPPAHQRR